MSKEINARIKHKRDVEANWILSNPTLLNGEIALIDVSDETLKLKIGDGSTAYESLQHFYFVPSATISDNSKILSVVNGVPRWSTQSQYNIEVLTQAEYDMLTTVNDNTLYVIEV